jgi:NMD protein affecting ribosome stability and mRNA decay
MSNPQPRHVNYFESILQLRSPDDELIGFVNDTIKSREDVTLAKRKKVRNGFDYYLSSNKFASELGRYLYNTFGGDLKITKKQFSQHRMTSKVLYRVTVLFRMSPFKVGNFVIIEGKAYKLTSFVKKDYVGTNLENGKLADFKLDFILRNAEKIEPVNAVITKSQPHLEVIHPATFQSVPVLYPSKEKGPFVPGEKAKIIVQEDQVWLAK